MKPLLISSGEPAGIGPDICLALAKQQLPVVILGDKHVLMDRAVALDMDITFYDYDKTSPFNVYPDGLTVWSVPVATPVVAGQLDPLNANYVLTMLTQATHACLQGEFAALITAPIHKAVINEAGVPFTGHTEFLAHHCQVDTVVMMLACDIMRVALITTHLPLQAVPAAITVPLIMRVITQLHQALQQDFGIEKPLILVAGLNPHAGEAGYLGREEIEVITPALQQLKQQSINVQGPFPADTMFTPANLARADAFVAMYHDQGLPVLKYAGFGQAVNVTLGLPIIRTSVDHGTALELAGTGLAEASSLLAAVTMAQAMANKRKNYHGQY